MATAQASHPPKRQVLCSWSREVLFLKRVCEQSAGLKARERNGARCAAPNLVHTSWAEICCFEPNGCLPCSIHMQLLHSSQEIPSYQWRCRC